MGGYLLFHSLTEMVGIAIAGTVFGLTWSTQAHRARGSSFFLLLGIASLFVGGIDLLHTLAYKGMSIFPGYDTNLPTQLWIVARYLQSLSLMLASLQLLLRRADDAYGTDRSPYLWLAGYAMVASALVFLVFSGDFPACYIEGSGLTPFKRISEYAICAILSAAALILWRGRAYLDREMLRFLMAAIVLSILTELAFSLYVDVYGLLNGLGHVLKVFVFLLLYKAIVLIGVQKPYTLLSRSLRESESRYRTIIGATPVPMALNDEGQNITYVNPAFVQTFGYSLADIPTLDDWWPRAYPDPEYRRWVADTWQARLDEARRMNTAFAPMEIAVNCKDGRSRTVLATAASFTASCAGEHLVLLYDITERKLSEKALEESEAKYRLLFENMKEGFSLHEIITDETGRAIDFRFLDANSAYKIHTGLNPVDVVGRTIRDILPDGDAGMIENYGRVALTGEPLTFEYYSKAFDRYLRVSAFSPQPRRFATIFEDITGRKTSESALQEASKENLNLLAELQHRAKNSFALISSLIILTSEKDLSPETKSAFEDLDARVRSISELYSLLYSSGSFTDVRLDEYLTRVSGGMAGLTLNISLTTDFDDITVSAKKAAPIGLIVTELLTNVFKYAFPDGRGGGIVIGLKKCAGGAALEVRDDGCGLPPGFVLAGNAGMGLRLVSGLARQIGGSFEIGGGASGTTCVVRFPMETNGAD